MNIPIITFNGGEVTQKIDSRIDTAKYSASCRSLKNMLPLIYGCVERRPGTKFINNCSGTGNCYGLLPYGSQTYGDA